MHGLRLLHQVTSHLVTGRKHGAILRCPAIILFLAKSDIVCLVLSGRLPLLGILLARLCANGGQPGMGGQLMP
jgi:hypothetical protein